MIKLCDNSTVVVPRDLLLSFRPFPLSISLLSGLEERLVSRHRFRLHTKRCVTCLVLNTLPAIFCLYPRLLNVFLSPQLLKLLHQNSICKEQKTHVAHVYIPTVKPKEYASSLYHKTDAYWCVSLFCCEVALKCHIWCFSETWKNIKHLIHYTPASLGAEQERQTPFSPCRHRGEPEYPRTTLQTVPLEWQTCKIPYPPSLHESLMANVSVY